MGEDTYKSISYTTYMYLPTYLPASLPASQSTYPYLPTCDEDQHVDHWNTIRFAVPRKSTRLYLSLTLVACDKVQLVDSTVFACPRDVCSGFVALL